jgi:NAD kinase
MKKLTIAFMIIITAIIIVFDIYVAVVGGDGDTISAVLLTYSKEYPVISFAIGFICGHIFWPNQLE